MQNLENRLVLVTGASAGIGAATARAFGRAGARVVLAARRIERLEALAAELPGSECVALDVRDEDAVLSALGSRAFDVVVNNAGLGRGLDPIQAGSPLDWDEMIDTNIKGVLHVVRATLPAMIERGSGDMLLLGSVAGRQVYPNGNVYCATKHAVRALYEAMRIDASGSGVRFSTVDPGIVETEFSEVRFHGDAERAKTVYADLRSLQPEDVAETIVWISSRPPHVNVGEVVLWPTDQASTTMVTRRGAKA